MDKQEVIEKLQAVANHDEKEQYRVEVERKSKFDMYRLKGFRHSATCMHVSKELLLPIEVLKHLKNLEQPDVEPTIYNNLNWITPNQLFQWYELPFPGILGNEILNYVEGRVHDLIKAANKGQVLGLASDLAVALAKLQPQNIYMFYDDEAALHIAFHTTRTYYNHSLEPAYSPYKLSDGGKLTEWPFVSRGPAQLERFDNLYCARLYIYRSTKRKKAEVSASIEKVLYE